jgi:hypothetical protein
MRAAHGGTGSRTDLEGEGDLKEFSVDSEEGVETEGAGLGGMDFEGERGAAVNVVAEDVATGGVELEKGFGAFVKGVEMGEGLQERFHAGDGLPGGVCDGELKHLELAAAQEQAFVTGDAELEAKAIDLTAHAGWGGLGDSGDIARDLEIDGGILREAGAGGREAGADAVGAAEGRGEGGGVAAGCGSGLGGEVMEVFEAWAGDEELHALRVHEPELVFENGLAVEGFEFGAEGEFFAGLGR